MSVDRLVLVYNSDHGLRGDFAYALRKVVKGESCSLFDVTHRIREKVEWRETRERLGVPVQVLYRDQATLAHRRAADERFPAVLGETGGETTLVLGPTEIDECNGSPELLELKLRELGAIPADGD